MATIAKKARNVKIIRRAKTASSEKGATLNKMGRVAKTANVPEIHRIDKKANVAKTARKSGFPKTGNMARMA